MNEIHNGMSIAQLELEHQERDAEVMRLRREQQAIHDILEPKREAVTRANAGPAHLAQTVGVGVKLRG